MGIATRMHINRGLLSWGIFLIVAGLIPLAVRAGWLSASQIAGWWNLWPLVLIGIGLGLVLTRTPFEVLGSVLVAGTFGLMLGAVLAIGIAGFPGSVCANEIGSTPYSEQTGTFDGPAEVDIEFNCGELAVTGAEGATWTFAGSGDGEVAPDVDADGSSLRIRGAERSFVPISTGERWNVTLPQDVALGIRVQLNAGNATVQSGAAQLTDVDIQVNFGSIVAELADATALASVDVQTNAGSASVTLPDVSMTGRLQVNAGSLEVCTPADAGVRIETGGGLGSNNFGEAGLVQDGDTWESPGYADAPTRIDLDAEANLGNIALNPEDGCAQQAD